MAHRLKDRGVALDVEEGLVHAGERGAGQILSRAGRAHRHGIPAERGVGGGDGGRDSLRKWNGLQGGPHPIESSLTGLIGGAERLAHRFGHLGRPQRLPVGGRGHGKGRRHRQPAA
ncbi:hypothetical protein D3C72_724360 [compost metagenome]